MSLIVVKAWLSRTERRLCNWSAEKKVGNGMKESGDINMSHPELCHYRFMT